MFLTVYTERNKHIDHILFLTVIGSFNLFDLAIVLGLFIVYILQLLIKFVLLITSDYLS